MSSSSRTGRARRRAAAAATLVALAFGATLPSWAQSRDVTLASGVPGGTYHDVWAVNLVAMLREYHIRIRQTRGSLENLELLASGEADIAFVQADVLAARLREQEERFRDITVVGRVRDECIYLARRREGPVTEVGSLRADVDGRPARIAVGPEGSGMNATWHYLRLLDPSLASAEVLDTAGTLALNHLELGMIDVVGWVTDPANREHVMLRAVEANDELDLLPIADAALEHSMESGTLVYEIEPVVRRVERGFLGLSEEVETIRTLCTSALVVTRAGANPRLVDSVSEVLSFQRERLLEGR